MNILLVFFLSFFAHSQLKEFKGTARNTEKLEAHFIDDIKRDQFCCYRQTQTGEAHKPQYNIEDFIRPSAYKKTPLKPASTGKK